MIIATVRTLSVRRVPCRGVRRSTSRSRRARRPAGRRAEEHEQGIRQTEGEQEPAEAFGHADLELEAAHAEMGLEVPEALLDLHAAPVGPDDIGRRPRRAGPTRDEQIPRRRERGVVIDDHVDRHPPVGVVEHVGVPHSRTGPPGHLAQLQPAALGLDDGAAQWRQIQAPNVRDRFRSKQRPDAILASRGRPHLFRALMPCSIARGA